MSTMSMKTATHTTRSVHRFRAPVASDDGRSAALACSIGETLRITVGAAPGVAISIDAPPISIRSPGVSEIRLDDPLTVDERAIRGPEVLDVQPSLAGSVSCA